MELRQLITFVHIVQMESFSKAAKRLGYSQSAVTVQIRLLEEELHTRLFDRMGKRCKLTAKGERFRIYAYNILQEVNQAKLALEDDTELKNELHVGTLDSLCFSKLPAILQHFRSHHPKAALRITTAEPEELIEMMEHNQLDLIYILDEPRYSNNWHKELEQREDVIFVASAEHPLAQEPALELEQLLAYPFYLTEQSANYRRAFDRYLASRKIVLRPFLETSNTEFIIRFLKESRGISLLPAYAVQEELLTGQLAKLQVADFHSTMYRQLFYHKDKWKTREMEEFIRLAKLEDKTGWQTA